jgi:hypothetical protein
VFLVSLLLSWSLVFFFAQGIKVELPSELTTAKCYLQLYVDFILAFQAKSRLVSRQPDLILPLAIMTSGSCSLLSCLLTDV